MGSRVGILARRAPGYQKLISSVIWLLKAVEVTHKGGSITPMAINPSER